MDSSTFLNRSLRTSPLVRARRAVALVTPLAWTLFGLAVLALVVGRRNGWEELVILGVSCVVVLILAMAFVLGRAELNVSVLVRPQRVTAGERAVAQVTATNKARVRLAGASMELVVGEGVADFALPALAAGESHEELFVLPTVRRAVIPVGPVVTVRSDPLGLLRRTRTWTDIQPLFVHPVTVPLAELGSGFIRDLEGKATDLVSEADVAFHTLREYVPGDDRRFIHWLSSARVGKLMIRQFIDTRRSHVAIVVDGSRNAYRNEDEFETAISGAASVGRRILLDEQEVSMVVAGERIPTSSGNAMLDALASVELGNRRAHLLPEIDHLFRYASGFSLGVLITGSATPVAEMRAAAVRFPEDVRILLLRVDPEADTGFRPLASDTLLTLGRLDDLAQLLWAAVT